MPGVRCENIIYSFHLRACLGSYFPTCMDICIIYIYIHIYIYIYIYISIYVYIYIFICIYIYTYINIYIFRLQRCSYRLESIIQKFFNLQAILTAWSSCGFCCCPWWTDITFIILMAFSVGSDRTRETSKIRWMPPVSCLTHCNIKIKMKNFNWFLSNCFC